MSLETVGRRHPLILSPNAKKNVHLLSITPYNVQVTILEFEVAMMYSAISPQAIIGSILDLIAMLMNCVERM